MNSQLMFIHSVEGRNTEAIPSAISDLAVVSLERTFDDLLGRRPRKPLIARGEPTHGVLELLRLRIDRWHTL